MKTPTYMLSFLDLLCSAIGTVIILIFIFSTQRANGSREALAPPSMFIVSIREAPPDFLLGREIWVQESTNRNSAFTPELSHKTSPPPAGKTVQIVPEQALAGLRIWVHSLPAAPSQAAADLFNGRSTIKLSVEFVRGDSRRQATPKTLELTKANGFKAYVSN